MTRTRLALSTTVVIGGLLLAAAAIPALAQSAGGTPLHQGGSPMTNPTMTAMMSGSGVMSGTGMMGEQGMMAMHGQLTSEQLGQMQQVHEQMPAELRDQMQAWHQQQGMAGMMAMMHAQDPAAMHAQMPQALQDQMRAWYAQAPDETRAQMQAMHASVAGMHGTDASAVCPMAGDGAATDIAPADEP